MTSTIEDGNMHPSLSVGSEDAQQNFERYCADIDREPSRLVGLRIKPGDTTSTIADLTTVTIEDRYFGSVACDERIRADAVIIPRSIGAFVLSGDCYPVTINASQHAAVLHLGHKAIGDDVLPQVVRRLRDIGYQPSELGMDVGPGIARESNIVRLRDARQIERRPSFWSQFVEPFEAFDGSPMVRVDLLTALLYQSTEAGVPISSTWIDGRNTFTHPSLYSRRASVLFGKQRGNHVYISAYSD